MLRIYLRGNRVGFPQVEALLLILEAQGVPELYSRAEERNEPVRCPKVTWFAS